MKEFSIFDDPKLWPEQALVVMLTMAFYGTLFTIVYAIYKAVHP